MALDDLAEACRPAALEACAECARELHLRAEREGCSEVATALWHVSQVLDAVFAGELPSKVGVWRQAKAACRSAAAACELIDKEVGAFGTLRTTRTLVVGGNRGFIAALTDSARKKRLEVSYVDDVTEGVEALREQEFDVVACVEDGPGSLKQKLEIVGRATAGRMPLAALALNDDFPGRIEAARANAQLFMRQSASPDAIVAGMASLASWREGEPARVLTLLGGDGSILLEALTEARIVSEPILEPELLLQTLGRYRPDVLLLDWETGDLRALELCRVLRADPAWKWLKILVRIPKRSTLAVAQALEAGADELFDESLSVPELVARISSGVKRSRSFQEDSNKDLLTSLLTRRAFTDAMGARLAEARRSKKLVSLCLIDVDRFKLVNDSRGHSIGDRVLASFGGLLSSRLRTEDLRGRWGGEEFVVAFYGEWALSAREVLSRVTSEFSKMDLSGGDGGPLHVTVSAGIATFPLDGVSLDDLVIVADRRLYSAKREGRNRINI